MIMCGNGDKRCDGDGVTACQGCHGWGVTSPRGKAYRWACKSLPAWAVAHEACHGTGLAVCGCVPVDDGTRAAIGPEARTAEPVGV